MTSLSDYIKNDKKMTSLSDYITHHSKDTNHLSQPRLHFSNRFQFKIWYLTNLKTNKLSKTSAPPKFLALHLTHSKYPLTDTTTEKHPTNLTKWPSVFLSSIHNPGEIHVTLQQYLNYASITCKDSDKNQLVDYNYPYWYQMLLI